MKHCVSQVNEVKLDKKVLERYLELEAKTREAEGRNVVKTLKAKEEELVDLDTTVRQLEVHHKHCVQQT